MSRLIQIIITICILMVLANVAGTSQAASLRKVILLEDTWRVRINPADRQTPPCFLPVPPSRP